MAIALALVVGSSSSGSSSSGSGSSGSGSGGSGSGSGSVHHNLQARSSSPPPVQLLLMDPPCNGLACCPSSFPSMSPHLSGSHLRACNGPKIWLKTAKCDSK